MKVKYVKTEKPVFAIPVQLRAVWCIEADHTYRVSRLEVEEKHLIAIRTTKGEGEIKLANGTQIILTQDTVCFFYLSEIRQYRCKENCWNFVWYEFLTEYPYKILFNNAIQLTEIRNETQINDSCLDFLLSEQEWMKAGASSIFGGLLANWLSQITVPNSKNPYQEKLSEIVLRLKNNLSENPTTKQLSQYIGLSERRFHDVFMLSLGVSPKKYLETLKISAARDLLENTSLSISEISENLGYSSQFHFCNAFKKVMQISPSKYRSNKN